MSLVQQINGSKFANKTPNLAIDEHNHDLNLNLGIVDDSGHTIVFSQPTINNTKINPSLNNKHQNEFKYGELILLGYNGNLHEGDKGRKRSKFELFRRNSSTATTNGKKGNGKEKCTMKHDPGLVDSGGGGNGLVFHSRQTITDINIIKSLSVHPPTAPLFKLGGDAHAHSSYISYSFGGNDERKGKTKKDLEWQNGMLDTAPNSFVILDEYRIDPNIDMFQIGRSPEKPIDFVVLDTRITKLDKHSNIIPPPKYLNDNNFKMVKRNIQQNRKINHAHPEAPLQQQITPFSLRILNAVTNLGNHNGVQASTSNQTNGPTQAANHKSPFTKLQLNSPRPNGGLPLPNNINNNNGINKNNNDIEDDNINNNVFDNNKKNNNNNDVDKFINQIYNNHKTITLAPQQLTESTISRFACRVMIQRNLPNCVRVFAAGFDDSRHIFLGPKAVKWRKGDRNQKVDGLTTNGILLSHDPSNIHQTSVPGIETNNTTTNGVNGAQINDPLVNNTNSPTRLHICDLNNPNQKNASGDEINTKTRQWFEVSVEGRLYTPRKPQAMFTCGKLIESQDNVLRDWTLIDICGATLLYRSAQSLQQSSPTARDIETYVESINAGKPQCPVRLSTLVVPRRSTPHPQTYSPQKLHNQILKNPKNIDNNCNYQANAENIISPTTHLIGCNNANPTNDSPIISSTSSSDGNNQAYVYLKCGHVQGLHPWGKQDNFNRKCPICQMIGPIAPLYPGNEPSFYRGFGPLTHSFVPCGHMTNQVTAEYWSNISIPSADFKRICPFCATELAYPNGFVKLHFQGEC